MRKRLHCANAKEIQEQWDQSRNASSVQNLGVCQVKVDLPFKKRSHSRLKDNPWSKLMNQQFMSRRAALSRLGAVGLVSLTSPLTACGGGGGTISPISETERQAQVKSQIDAVLAGDWTAGKPGLSVLVRLAGVEIYKSSRGSADAVSTPITSSTAFEIASITKVLTATVVMQLVEKEILALTDPITRWLPVFPSDWSLIQLRHLLSHSSGIPEFFENKPPSEPDGLTHTPSL